MSSRHPERHDKANIALRNCLAEVRNYCACEIHRLKRRGLLYELPEPHFGRLRIGQEAQNNKIIFQSFIER